MCQGVKVRVGLMHCLRQTWQIPDTPFTVLTADSCSTMSHEELKQKGNECFKQQNYDEAISLYTKALEVCPTSHTVYSNRSLVLSKLRLYSDALVDAEQCISLDPKFARGYLRKCVALKGLGRYEETMEAAQEGYKLRGSDTVCRDCINQWLEANQAIYRVRVQEFQKEIETELNIPDQCLVISDAYLNLFLNVLHARLNNTMIGIPVKFLRACLKGIFQELDRVLGLFGHSPTPLEQEWIVALCQAGQCDPSTAEISPTIITALQRKSEALAAWFDSEVDPILYPIVRPVVSLALFAVNTRCISLNALNTNHHVVEIACCACLPFFEKSPLTTPLYAEQQIGLYKEMLEALSTTTQTFTSDKVKFIEESIKKLQTLIQETPSCPEFIQQRALGSIEMIRTRLGQTDSFSPEHLDSFNTPDELLSFVEAKKLTLQSILDDQEKQPPHDYVFGDAQVLLSHTGKSPQLVITRDNTLCSSYHVTCNSIIKCDFHFSVVSIGALVEAGEVEKAQEVFLLGESVFRRLLKAQVANKSFNLDQAPELLSIMQTMIFTGMKPFCNTDNDLVADSIIRWKCIFSEFRALLMQLGVGSHYLETFRTIQDMDVHSKEGKNFTQLAEHHRETVSMEIKVKGQVCLMKLLTQTHHELQDILKPGQMILDYCPLPRKYSYSQVESAASKEMLLTTAEGVLVALQLGSDPIIKVINLKEAWAGARKWVEAAPKADAPRDDIDITQQSKVKELFHELCNLLIPSDIQSLLCSGQIKQLFLSPDPHLMVYPLERLPLRNGQLLGEVCSLVYLSSARELLRNSSLLAIQNALPPVKQPSGARETATVVDLKTQKSKECVIIADPNYDLECPSEERPGLIENLIASLGMWFLQSSRPIPPLPQTRDEAYKIQCALSTSLKVRCILGNEATLSTVLMVESPFVLHLSTHGFSKAEVLGTAGTFVDDTKCGLALAGINTYLQGKLKKVVVQAGTGQLTALAAMGMNLEGTRLVYLSACVAAQGSVASGEAINSLAQAFRAAGAQTVIATRWTVFDDEARMFAIHFYLEACKSGVRPSQALACAKKKLEKSGVHWIYWSGFVCVGEDVPLFPKCD